ncbi:MAG: tetratricopeptide repeat protein [Spirochaetota bacterium]
MKRLSFIAVAAVVLLGCRTVPTEIPEDLTQAELIQLAQGATEQENWEAAQAYYRAIVDRYPDDRAAIATARYEIAFIEYKRGNFDEAERRFDELLGMYDVEREELPAWPRVLANRVLEKMEDERERAAAAEATADPAATAEE